MDVRQRCEKAPANLHSARVATGKGFVCFLKPFSV